MIFSCTKGLVAILIGELVRKGRLDLDAPASAYWPEFAARGKDSIPVRWLLSHQEFYDPQGVVLVQALRRLLNA